MARASNSCTAADVQPLRAAGYDDGPVLALITFLALRLAFATVNDALGAGPDPLLVASAPAPVVAAVPFGRPPG